MIRNHFDAGAAYAGIQCGEFAARPIFGQRGQIGVRQLIRPQSALESAGKNGEIVRPKRMIEVLLADQAGKKQSRALKISRVAFYIHGNARKS